MFFNNLSGIVRQDEGSHKQSEKAGCWIRGGWQGQDHFGGIKTAKTNTSCGELSFQLGRSWGLGLMLHFCMVWITPQDLKTSSPCWLQNSDGGSRGGPGGSAPIFILVKKKIVEGRKAGRESDKKNLFSPLSSRSGSATEHLVHIASSDKFLNLHQLSSFHCQKRYIWIVLI